MPAAGSDRQDHDIPANTGITSPSSKKGRRYRFACTACKGRKVKCSGEQPVCAGCRRSGVKCIWPSNTPAVESQLLRDANERIRHLEANLQQQTSTQPLSNPIDDPLQDSPRQISEGDVDSPLVDQAHVASRRRRPSGLDASYHSLTTSQKRPRRGSHRYVSGVAARLASRSESGHASSPRSAQGDAATSVASTAADARPDSALDPSLWYQVGIGEDGAVVYNGPTSRFHAGTLITQENNEKSECHRGQNDSSDRELETTQSNFDDCESSGNDGIELSPEPMAIFQSHYALMDSVWSPIIAAKPTMNGTGVDTKTGIALLDIYWIWLHPLHHLVYRPAFVMDLALGGPNCSDFLLLCIFALAARHLASEETGSSTDGNVGRGEQYVKRAKALLQDELEASTPAIPTIQGLLILGGRQSAMGLSSQGWLYTGMAFRMMQDIGLHLDTTRLMGVADRLTPAELEGRKRLYNSAYVWDKTLSLALGRPPTLIRKPYPTHEILDQCDNPRPWRPVHAKEVAEPFMSSPSMVTATMCAFCSLHEITTNMLLLFSQSYGASSFSEQVRDLDRRFQLWYDATPEELKIEQADQLKQSPPPHIVSLNLLYHTLHILLRRPFLRETNGTRPTVANEHIGHCIESSKKIHAIYTLYARTFPHRLMTYQVSYCIYTAATVEALELKSSSLSSEDREGAASRLTAAIRILQNEASHTPGSGKSLDTIRRLLTENQRQSNRTPRPRRGQSGRVTSQDGSANQIQREREEFNESVDRPRASLFDRAGMEERCEVRLSSGNAHGSAGTEREVTEGVLGLRGNVGQAAPLTTEHNTRNVISSHNGPSEPIVDQGSADVFDGYGNTWESSFGFFGGTDTGAGFHPESSSWVNTENLMRMPSSTMPTSATHFSYPGWAAQGYWPVTDA